MQHAPWSPSKADKALQCAYAFHRQYTDKAPRTSNTYARTGVTVHRAQELILEGTRAKTAVQLAIEENEELTHQEKELVVTFTDAMTEFEARMKRFVHKHGVSQILLEKKWAITEDFEACDFFDKERAMVRGVVDVAMVTKKGFVIIIDHKSGKKKPINKFTLQLDTYVVMAYAAFPECKGVQSALHFVKHRDILWDTMRTPDHIVGVLQPWLKGHLAKAGSHVSGRHPNTGWWCNWCDFKTECPVWEEDGTGKG